jgi:hypothetical protein
VCAGVAHAARAAGDEGGAALPPEIVAAFLQSSTMVSQVTRVHPSEAAAGEEDDSVRCPGSPAPHLPCLPTSSRGLPITLLLLTVPNRPRQHSHAVNLSSIPPPLMRRHHGDASTRCIIPCRMMVAVVRMRLCAVPAAQAACSHYSKTRLLAPRQQQQQLLLQLRVQ